MGIHYPDRYEHDCFEAEKRNVKREKEKKIYRSGSGTNKSKKRKFEESNDE